MSKRRELRDLTSKLAKVIHEISLAQQDDDEPLSPIAYRELEWACQDVKVELDNWLQYE